jgi:hypothetical protein
VFLIDISSQTEFEDGKLFANQSLKTGKGVSIIFLHFIWISSMTKLSLSCFSKILLINFQNPWATNIDCRYACKTNADLQPKLVEICYTII